jgi:hypothetical protein
VSVGTLRRAMRERIGRALARVKLSARCCCVILSVMATETPVSKTSPAIKQIIAATVGASWGGKKIVVREVPSSWEHTEYIDDKTLAWYLNLATLRVWQPERVRYGGLAVMHPAPKIGEALIHVLRLQGPQSMQIIVQEDAIDSATVSVVTDALLARDKKSAEAAAKRCGVSGGLCLALAEAHAKALKKVESGERPKTTRSVRQLDREIKAALSRR